MHPDAIFRIYSMTKPLVSVAAKMWVEYGKMQLTDPISKFMPEFAKMQVSVAITSAPLSSQPYHRTTCSRSVVDGGGRLYRRPGLHGAPRAGTFNHSQGGLAS